MIERTVSPREFSRRTGYNPQTVYANLQAGRIPATKVDGEWRIPEAEVHKAAERRATWVESLAATG
jgi:excisionase family DNA binding protein